MYVLNIGYDIKLLTPPPALIHTASHQVLKAELPTFKKNVKNTIIATK